MAAGCKSLTDGGARAARVCSWFTVTAARVCGAGAICHFRLARGKVKTVTQGDTRGVKRPRIHFSTGDNKAPELYGFNYCDFFFFFFNVLFFKGTV